MGVITTESSVVALTTGVAVKTPVVSPGATTTVTFANTSAGSGGTSTPIQTTQVFQRGAVPPGYIAVPQYNTSDLTIWQADNLVYFDDGSLMLGVYRMVVPAVIGAGETAQISFVIQVGTWPNTSSITRSSGFFLCRWFKPVDGRRRWHGCHAHQQ